jgi:hypothetical protein
MVSREMLSGRSSLSTTPFRKRIHSGSSASHLDSNGGGCISIRMSVSRASHLGRGSGVRSTHTNTNSRSASSGVRSTDTIPDLFVFVQRRRGSLGLGEDLATTYY